MSADVVLKMTTILKEMRIAQLSSYNERTLGKEIRSTNKSKFTIKLVSSLIPRAKSLEISRFSTLEISRPCTIEISRN